MPTPEQPLESNPGQQQLAALLAAFHTGADEVRRLFTETAVIEFPYAASVGTPGRLTVPAYHQYLTQVLPTMPQLAYERVRVYSLQAAGEYFAELRAATTMPGTGRRYEQDYVIYFALADGRFTHYREYWNPVPWLRAFGGEQALHEALH